MNQQVSKSNSQSRIIPVIYLGLFCAAVLWQSTTVFGDEPQIIRIEEDWEMEIFIPEGSTICSPQLVFQMAPRSGSRYTCLFLLNHLDYPIFSPGGAQVQVWDYDTLMNTRSFIAPAFHVQGEKVTWTQYMHRYNDHLFFGVEDGSSVSMGDLGDAHLHTGVSSARPYFTNYKWQDSAENASVVFGSQRIKYLTLKRVRKLNSDLETTETTVDFLVSLE